ncbi:hypothetical protein [Marinagarivorans cellulosilyticus]|nr:hypothetical protein [Marinagarivorans cellulosilyticus]
MTDSSSQEYLKEKYSEYCEKPTALHQRSHDYLKLRSEPIDVLAFLLVEIDSNHRSSPADPSALLGLRSAVQVIINERIARRQEEITLRLNRTGRRLAWVGIFVGVVGAAATIAGIFL